MKIKINNNETYSIKIPDELGNDEFLGLLDRLNRIQKSFMKDVVTNELGVQTPNTIKQTKRNNNWSTYKNDKQMCIQILRAYYYKDNQVLAPFREKYGYVGGNYRTITKTMAQFRLWHPIAPDDVGLKRWPSVGEAKTMSNLYLQPNNTQEVTNNVSKV